MNPSNMKKKVNISLYESKKIPREFDYFTTYIVKDMMDDVYSFNNLLSFCESTYPDKFFELYSDLKHSGNVENRNIIIDTTSLLDKYAGRLLSKSNIMRLHKKNYIIIITENVEPEFLCISNMVYFSSYRIYNKIGHYHDKYEFGEVENQIFTSFYFMLRLKDDNNLFLHTKELYIVKKEPFVRENSPESRVVKILTSSPKSNLDMLLEVSNVEPEISRIA